MAASNITILIQAKDQASKQIESVSSALDNSATSSRNADAAFASFARTAGVGLLAAAAAATAGLGAAIKSSGDYQSSLSKLQQASGATNDQMSQMASLARQLGRDNSLAGVTASDAAVSMVELSKAGLSVNDTMGAARGVMSLAKAGNIEFADAATIAASALNAFGLQGKDASKVADTLAAGANASQADLADLALGLQQSATVAKQFKLSMNENVTALALFANNGIRGSDAGTSLKTMLISLAHPSDQAAAAMKDIGFSAYDAQGKFVGLEEMSKRLATSTNKLTDQQKQETLATIFGTDAFRAASVLAASAGDSYASMSKAVGKSGAAQDAARAQMGAYQKATEGLGNQMSELGLKIGLKLLPYVTEATNSFANFISSVTQGLPAAKQAFEDQLPVIAGLTAGIIAFTIAQNAAAVATQALAIAQGAWNLALTANPIALIVGALAAVTVGFIAVATRSNDAANAQNALNLAQQRGVQAANNLHDANLNLEGANLRVELAQRNYNNAVAQFGPDSLEARQAHHDLELAQDSQKRAVQDLKKKTDEAKSANDNIVKQKDAVKKAMGEMKLATDTLSTGYAGIAAQAANAQRIINAMPDNAGKKIAQAQHNQSQWLVDGNKPLLGHALGTSSSPGGWRMVGENGPEVMNVPQGAQVIPNYRTNQMQSQGGDTNITISGTINIQTPEAANAFWDRIDKTQRLAKVGMA